MKLADALAVTLRDWDLKYLFGVSGANIEQFHDAVHRLGDGRFRSICAKSEVGAAFMADGRARVHRTLGVCCSTAGGAMMNLAVGVAESFAESVPVLAIVGQPPTNLEGRGAFQDSSGIGRSVNAAGLWAAISKFQARITEPGQFWQALVSAVTEALSGRQGPAVLMIPRDLWDSEVGPRPSWIPGRIDESAPQNVSAHEVVELFDAIRAAESPVLLLGSGVDRCSNPGAVVAFARRLGIRTATTLASKGAFPNDDALYLGTVGVAGEPSAHHFLNRQADLIIAVGTGLNVMTSQPIQQALQPQRLAVVNIDMGEVSRIVSPSLAIEADAGTVFESLNQLCQQVSVVPRAPVSVPVSRYVPVLAPELPAHRIDSCPDPGTDDLLQSQALKMLQPMLPASGHIFFDAGNCAAAAMHYLRVPKDVSATIALGMGGMGYAIPAAVGAQLGSSHGSRTMVFCGDGGFMTLGPEVHTAVHYQLPILFVVFNNGMHGMCVTRQQMYFEGRIECSRYPAVSVAEVARGFGSTDRLWVGSAGTVEELKELLRDHSYWTGRPGVLELRLRREEVPPFTPFLPSDAATYRAEGPINGHMPSQRPNGNSKCTGKSVTTDDCSVPLRIHDVRRELRLMRALQNPIVGPVLQRVAGPEKILNQGMAFWSSRVVLLAVEFGVFTELAGDPLAADEIMRRFGWHPRAAGPFLDALVAMGHLRRDRGGLYRNSRHSALFLDRAKPSYIGGLLELSSKRLYDLWSGLGNLLRTGHPEADEERGGNEFFSSLYRDPEALSEFLSGMTGISTGEAILIAVRFPWKRYKTFVDIGAAQGALPVRVALTHSHLTGASYDLPAVEPIFEEYVASFGLVDRLRFIPGDMNDGPLPEAEVICFGHLLHGYGEAKRRELISKAYTALPPEGALLVYDAMIDSGRRQNFMGMLSSLNIMLETREGFEATTQQCAGWLRDAGFVDVTTRPVIGPTSMVFGFKPADSSRTGA